MWSVPRGYLEDNWGDPGTRVEAGSNTSTVTLRVVGGDEKGSLKSETVKYGREYQRTRTRDRLRWRSIRLSSERGAPQNYGAYVKSNSRLNVFTSGIYI
jgi:hypothetical protein